MVVHLELARNIADAYAAGGTQREVAEQFGTYPRKVREALRIHGVEARVAGTRLEDPNETAAWAELYQQGWTLQRIADEHQTGVNGVARRLRKWE